jgi:VWFA-related protein
MLLRLASRCVLLSPLVIPALMHGQQAGSVPEKGSTTTTLSVNAQLVNLPVIVRDKKGALVQSLTKDDFVLSVDGKPQTIRYFDRDNNLPLTLGLLVDTSMSQRKVLDEERTASASFVDQMVTAPEKRAPDQAFVIQFARETELLQDLTSSRPKLQAALKEIGDSNSGANSNDSSQDSGNSGNSNGRGGRRGGGTALYDAIFLSTDELMAKQHGRKALVILTDGVDNGSKESLTHAIEAAQRADTVVYSIYFKGEDHQNSNNGFPGGGGRHGGGFPGGGGGYPGGGGGYPGGGGGYPGGGGGYPGGGGGRGGGGNGRNTESRVDGKKILERISGETGGRMFEVSKKQKVADIYTQIAEELRSQYRLGYTPDKETAGDGYHLIDLTAPKQKDLRIQTREGYYTGK